MGKHQVHDEHGTDTCAKAVHQPYELQGSVYTQYITFMLYIRCCFWLDITLQISTAYSVLCSSGMYFLPLRTNRSPRCLAQICSLNCNPVQPREPTARIPRLQGHFCASWGVCERQRAASAKFN